MTKNKAAYWTFRTRAGDRWDLLALQHYGNALLIEPIIRANPSVPPLASLPSGLLLTIPQIDVPKPTIPDSKLPPWKRRGAA